VIDRKRFNDGNSFDVGKHDREKVLARGCLEFSRTAA
jgi:hypothetical protein